MGIVSREKITGIRAKLNQLAAEFFAAVILMNVLGRMIGTGFEMFIAGTSQRKIVGITGTFSMLVILGIVVIMTANKFFSLIHYLPEHVTNWIGRQFHSLGEKEDQAGVKGVFVGSANVVSSGAHGVRELRTEIMRQNAGRNAGTSVAPAVETPPAAPAAATASAADKDRVAGTTPGRVQHGNFRPAQRFRGAETV
jgi:hypothetical protein